MDVRQELMSAVKGRPEFQAAVDQIEEQLMQLNVSPQMISELIKALEFVLQNPDQYQSVLQQAIEAGIVQPGQLPEQYDAGLIVVLLAALYELQDRSSATPYGFSKGGLNQVARRLENKGRGGDSILAHINPMEAEMLRRMGGRGSVNPHTGLLEFKGGGIGAVLGIVASIAVPFLAPVVGTAIAGTSLGAVIGATGSNILAGSLLGAASSAISGGNVLQGALMGGVGQGLGGMLGSAVAPNASQTVQGAIGGALVGGAAGAATGQGFAQGALQGAAGGALGGYAEGMAPGVLKSGLQGVGTALQTGRKPKEALMAGALSGLASGIKGFLGPNAPEPVYTPGAEAPPEVAAAPEAIPEISLVQQQPTAADYTAAPDAGYSLTGGQPATLSNISQQIGNVNQAAMPQAGVSPYSLAAAQQGPSAPIQAPTAPDSMYALAPVGTTSGNLGAPIEGPAQSGLSLGTVGKAALALSPLALSALTSAKTPEQVKSAMSPWAQENMQRGLENWIDWDRVQQEANMAGMGLGEYVAKNWDKVQAKEYAPAAQPVAAARGGHILAHPRLARGGGSGRADTIHARLSDGEYVIDAETVALLGDGSVQEGARRLDEMRAGIRKQKGKALARGKISPDAKSPLAYLKGAV